MGVGGAVDGTGRNTGGAWAWTELWMKGKGRETGGACGGQRDGRCVGWGRK